MTLWNPDDNVSLPAVLDARADLSPDKVALTIADRTLTFGAMASGSVSYANGLAEIGVTAGDAVTLLMDNSAEGVLGWLGISRLGAVDIPLNTAYADRFLQRTLVNAGSSVTLCDEKYLSTLLAVAPESGVKTIVVRGGDADSLARVRAAGIEAFGWTALTDNPASRVTHGTAPAHTGPSSVIYTSGTTGASKGVVFSHNYLLSAARQMVTLYQGTEDDVYFGSMPLFHLAAKACGVVGAILTGGSTVLDQKFSVSRTWPRVREHGATIVHLLGSMMVMLAKLPETPEDATLPMRAVFAAPVPGYLHREFERRYQCRIVTCYALSEACSITRGGLDEEYPLNSAGRVNESLFDVRLVTDAGEDVAPREVGEIIVRPKSPRVMFDGYWRNPEATLGQITDLWFHTGDLGRVDADGWFFYEGRKKDALRRRGENVSVAELEDAIRAHPAVSDVAAIGIPSDVLEDDIMVCVELAPGEVVEHADLLQFCVAELPFFMVPRYIRVVAELPRNPIAKVEKHRLRSQGLTATTWDASVKAFVTI